MNKQQIPSPIPFAQHLCVCGIRRGVHHLGDVDHQFTPVDFPDRRFVASTPDPLSDAWRTDDVWATAWRTRKAGAL